MQNQRVFVGVSSLTAIIFGFAAFAAIPAFAESNPCPIEHPCTNMPYNTDDHGTTAGTYCPQLSQTVVRGSSGNQVLELQKFLSDYYDIPPATIQTGYFDRITQGYVIQFQKEQGLPSYGIAGSMTRAAIAKVCGGSNVINDFKSNPTSGAAPLTVGFGFTTNSREAFRVDFGDGEIGNAYSACDEVSYTEYCLTHRYTQHTYKIPGTYTAKLIKLPPCNDVIMNAVPSSGATNVQVSSSAMCSGEGGVPIASVTITVSGSINVSAGKYWLLAHPGPDRIVVGQEGTWTVQLAPYQNNNDGVSYTIDWGDGSPASNAAVPALLTHAYQKPGRYPLSVALGGAYPTKLETYSYVTVVASSDAGACDTQYATAMQASKKEGCQIGGWMMMCKADQNNPNYQNIAYNSCMLKELEQKGWVMPKAL